jgi:hypothetical protein
MFQGHKLWARFSFKRNIFIKDNGKIMKEPEEECNSGEMVPFMRDIGGKMWRMDMEDLFMLMETSI